MSIGSKPRQRSWPNKDEIHTVIISYKEAQRLLPIFKEKLFMVHSQSDRAPYRIIVDELLNVQGDHVYALGGYQMVLSKVAMDVFKRVKDQEKKNE